MVLLRQLDDTSMYIYIYYVFSCTKGIYMYQIAILYQYIRKICSGTVRISSYNYYEEHSRALVAWDIYHKCLESLTYTILYERAQLRVLTPWMCPDLVFQQSTLFYAGCTHGSARIVDGTSSQEGRVEVCLNGLWGTVCDESWSQIDANIVCWQLGYSNAGIYGVTVIMHPSQRETLCTAIRFISRFYCLLICILWRRNYPHSHDQYLLFWKWNTPSKLHL